MKIIIRFFVISLLVVNAAWCQQTLSFFNEGDGVHFQNDSMADRGNQRTAGDFDRIMEQSYIRAPAQPQTAPNTAVLPVDRIAEGWWEDRHKEILEAVKAHPDTQLLLIGDSITNNYDKTHPPDEDFQPTWKQFYEPRKTLNLGFSGDTTGNVLWRLDHGEVDGLHPKAVVLLIGTNNTGRGNNTAAETNAGIDAVVADLETRLPETHILLLGLLPSGISEEKTQNDQAINRYLAQCYSEDPRVSYLDIGSIFFQDGKLNAAIFYDPRLPQHSKPLHPDTQGQHMMAEAIEPTLAKLMGDGPRMPLASMTDINTALIPIPRLEQDSYDWFARHHAEVAREKEMTPQVVLIGDSITHFWSGAPLARRVSGPKAWDSVFGTMPVLNMGFGWDRTQNVLWRLRQGEFDGVQPKWVVLNIGTNNLSATSNARANTPEEIVQGIEAICAEVHRRSPGSHILLMAIFPRGMQPGNPFRAPIEQVNQLLKARFGNDSTVTVLDIGKQFLAPDGVLPPSMMPDGTHPSEDGYQIWADALIASGVGR
jgi:lysophospholipase L1-like esterase